MQSLTVRTCPTRPDNLSSSWAMLLLGDRELQQRYFG
jgi:hypothetical protein